MWEEAYKADLEYQDTHNGEHPDDIAIGNYTGYVVPEPVKPPNSSGTPVASTTTSSQSPTEQSNGGPKPSLEVGSSIQVKSSATHFGSKSGGLPMASFVPGGNYTVYSTSDNEVLIGRDGAYTGWINKSDVVGYGSGTKNATAGIHKIDEFGEEYIFTSPSDGSRYRIFTGGEKVLNASATDFLYNFATTGGNVLTRMLNNMLGVDNFGNIARPIQNIEIRAGDVIVRGNADKQTVSDIRRAQRENLEFVLKEFNRLNK